MVDLDPLYLLIMYISLGLEGFDKSNYRPAKAEPIPTINLLTKIGILDVVFMCCNGRKKEYPLTCTAFLLDLIITFPGYKP